MIRRAALLAAAAVVAGCGSDGGGEKPDPQTIVRAAEQTEARGGVHISFAATMEGRGIPDGLAFHGQGDEDRRARTAEYEVDLSPIARLDDSIGSPDELVGTTVKRGPVVWLKLPALDELVTALGFPPAKWVEMDLRQRPESSSEVGRSLAQLNEQDPGQLLDYVYVAEATERLGEERFGGVRTTRYRGKVVLDEVVEALPADERPAVEANIDRVRHGTGEDELPIDVWIGDDALIRRIRLRYEFERHPKSGADIELRIEATATLSGFGRRVEPRVPPEGEVVEVTELVEAAE